MKEFEIRYSVDGKSGYMTYVKAMNVNSARQVALGEIQGQAGYANKKIKITAIREIR